jgi:hypothetical protein
MVSTSNHLTNNPSQAGNLQSGQEFPGLEFPGLERHLQSDNSFLTAYARTLAAIAAADKNVSLADFSALLEVARNSQYSALMAMVMFHALEQGVTLDKSLAELARAQAQTDSRESAAAFSMAMPLLAGQGHFARALAKRLAGALNVTLSAEVLATLPPEDDIGLIGQWSATARRLVKGRDVTDSVLEFGRDMAHPDIIRAARACQSGNLSRHELVQQFTELARRIETDIADYRASTQQPQAQPGTGVNAVAAMAEELRQQIGQRLAIVNARIAYERQIFAEDIDDLVVDCGNAIENSISERLNTDAWKDKDVWASIAKTDFGKEAERRITRAVRRREEVLRLFKEELKLFQSDMQVVQASILSRQHHAELAQLMPPLRIGTRVVNAMDSTANLALQAGTIAVAGTGAAVYVLGSAVVLPLVAPVAPFVLGAMAAAGLFKWMTDNDKRKIAEIASKRRAIEEVVRKRLEEAATSFNSQLQQVELEYRQTALALLGPILLDAEAARRLQEAHRQIAEKIIARSEAGMKRLSQELQ